MIYYCHLSQRLVNTGMYVEEGDVLFYLDKDLEVRMKEAEVELALRKKNYEVAVKQFNEPYPDFLFRLH